MAIRTIITKEDERLRKHSREVGSVDDPRIQALIEDMIDTLKACEIGVGLSAVQVGVLRRIFIIDLMDDEGLRVFVNPEIIDKQGEQCYQEGCLSAPDEWGMVKRPAYVKVKALDRTGKPFELEATGLLAVCICHEYDHLDGIMFFDHLEVDPEVQAALREKFMAEVEQYG